MSFENWDEIRTAYHVARMGTVSGAADALGVHHATVIRHVDSLEERLGVKLFQRHARGYTATEAGQDLLQVAQTTDDQLTQLVGRIKGRGDNVSGDLVVTSLAGHAPMIMPTLIKFRASYPELTIRYLTGDRLFRLEYGEAHVALRAGSVPDQPDNVVQPLFTQNFALYAAPSYIEEHGHPTMDNLDDHFFVCQDAENSRAPFYRWLRENVPAERLVFLGSENRVLERAVLDGAGVGFLGVWEANRHEGLVQVCPPREEWAARIWLVTHVDLHRTTKVQTFLKFLKADLANWGEL